MATNKKQRFNMLAYSGAPIEMGWWGTLVIDVNGIRTASKMPALREHIRDRAVGVIDSTARTSHQLTASGYFLDSRDGCEVQSLLEQGYPFEASVAVWALAVEELKKDVKVQVNGRTIIGPAVIWRQSEVREISFVSLGADSHTSAGIAASAGGPLMDPEQTFEGKVASLIQAGKSKGAAVIEAARKFPELHREYLARVRNPVGSRRREIAGQTHNSGPAVAKWNEAIKQLRAKGLSKVEAIRKLAREQPDLHRAFLHECQ